MALTTDEIIGDALAGIEALRPGNAVLAEYDAKAASVVGIALTLAYEGLVVIRKALAESNPEDIEAALAGKAERVIQELAALRFGAMP